MKKNPEVVDAYVKQLLRFPDTSLEVEELIRKTLKHHFQPELVDVSHGDAAFYQFESTISDCGCLAQIVW